MLALCDILIQIERRYIYHSTYVFMNHVKCVIHFYYGFKNVGLQAGVIMDCDVTAHIYLRDDESD